MKDDVDGQSRSRPNDKVTRGSDETTILCDEEEIRQVSLNELKADDSNPKLADYAQQLFFTMVLSSSMFVVGFIIGSTSMLPSMIAPNGNKTDLNTYDLKWLSSTTLLWGIPGTIIGYLFCSIFGPRMTFLWSHPFVLIPYLLMTYMPTLPVFYVARYTLEIAVGLYDVIVFSLVAELSHPNIRGFTSGIASITTSFAVLMAYVTCTILPKYAAFINTIPVLFGFIGAFFVPENVCSDRNAWKPVFIVTVTFLLKEISGCSLVSFYSLFIFKNANVPIDAFVCTVLVGVIRLVANIGCIFCYDKVGRKPILIISFSISGVSFILAGVALIIDLPEVRWIPIVSLLLITVMIGIGTGPVPWILLGELVPSHLRILGPGLITFFICICQFCMLTIIPVMLVSISLGQSFVLFGIINFIAAGIILIILPETRLKSLDENEKLICDGK